MGCLAFAERIKEGDYDAYVTWRHLKIGASRYIAREVYRILISTATPLAPIGP